MYHPTTQAFHPLHPSAASPPQESGDGVCEAEVAQTLMAADSASATAQLQETSLQPHKVPDLPTLQHAVVGRIPSSFAPSLPPEPPNLPAPAPALSATSASPAPPASPAPQTPAPVLLTPVTSAAPHAPYVVNAAAAAATDAAFDPLYSRCWPTIEELLTDVHRASMTAGFGIVKRSSSNWNKVVNAYTRISLECEKAAHRGPKLRKADGPNAPIRPPGSRKRSVRRENCGWQIAAVLPLKGPDSTKGWRLKWPGNARQHNHALATDIGLIPALRRAAKKDPAIVLPMSSRSITSPETSVDASPFGDKAIAITGASRTQSMV